MLRYGDFATDLDPYYETLDLNQNLDEETLNSMTKDPVIENVQEVLNKRLGQYRSKMMLLPKILLTYQLLGALLVAVSAAIVGYIMNFISSLVLVAIYLLSLLACMKVSNRRTKQLELVYLFNLALVLENLNRNPGEGVPALNNRTDTE